mmetsp:Transcript_96782/g.273478  ORF Transcript_96782/g.273478 Transcript_96782/m.273478 type:complete len:201 (-) Transcript_96782:252-854(-)
MELFLEPLQTLRPVVLLRVHVFADTAQKNDLLGKNCRLAVALQLVHLSLHHPTHERELVLKWRCAAPRAGVSSRVDIKRVHQGTAVGLHDTGKSGWHVIMQCRLIERDARLLHASIIRVLGRYRNHAKFHLAFLRLFTWPILRACTLTCTSLRDHSASMRAYNDHLEIVLGCPMLCHWDHGAIWSFHTQPVRSRCRYSRQ